jgi:hypothetical protein
LFSQARWRWRSSSLQVKAGSSRRTWYCGPICRSRRRRSRANPRRPPTPDPTPETSPAANPIPSQPGQPAEPEQPPSSREAAGSKGRVPSAQTFTGIIDKESDSFMLKVSEGTSYKLDNQQEVQQYEGKRVRVTGTLDASINLIHVDKIEPLS